MVLPTAKDVWMGSLGSSMIVRDCSLFGDEEELR